jgi:hypothetical protein
MSNCTRCGCAKPCACDYYTPDDYDNCRRCGCAKPCNCDMYTPKEDQERPKPYSDPWPDL